MTTVGIVVPTRNSERTIAACLESLRTQTQPCTIVVVDNHSSDATAAIAGNLADHVLIQGPERSAQRNAGAAVLGTDIIGFVDSDMVLAPGVADEVVRTVDAHHRAVIVPERSVGDGFWAHVRAFERSFYVGDDGVEAARFFSSDLFSVLGGFDIDLNAGEDWDLTIRARQVTEIARISAKIDHDEGRLTYRAACAKKASYASGLSHFHEKHGYSALRGALNRPYLRQPWRLLSPHPLLGAGVLALKSGELGAVGWSLYRQRTATASTPPTQRGAGPPTSATTNTDN